MAVLPTPGSPISTGLFLVLLESILTVLLISSSLPITGSSLCFLANSTRFVPYLARASYVPSGSCVSTLWLPLTSWSTFIKLFLLTPYLFKISLVAPFLSTSNIASIRCSTLIYESLNSFAISSAAISTLSISLVIYGPAPSEPLPDTFGILSKADATSNFIIFILMPIFVKIFGTNPSSCSNKAENKWIISICWWLYFTAVKFASFNACCTLNVIFSTFIYFTSFIFSYYIIIVIQKSKKVKVYFNLFFFLYYYQYFCFIII